MSKHKHISILVLTLFTTLLFLSNVALASITSSGDINLNETFYLNSTTNMVGIGTADPSKLLHLYGPGADIRLQDNNTGSVGLQILNGPSEQQWTFGVSSSYSAQIADDTAGEVYFSILNGSGNVGIGTTAPGTDLEVSGTAVNPATSGTTSSGITRIKASTGSVLDFGALSVSPWSQYLQVYDASNLAVEYPLSLQPNGGNVGIGTTTPSHKLTVVGLSNFTDTILVDQADNNRGVRVNSDATSAGAYTAYNNAVWTGTDGLLDLYIDNAASTGVGARIRYDGTGKGLFVDHNGATGFGVELDCESASHCFIMNSASTTDYAQSIEFAKYGLELKDLGTNTNGIGLLIDINNNNRGIQMDHDGTSARAFEIDSTQTSSEIAYIISTAEMLNSGTNSVMRLRHNTGSSTAPLLILENAGSGVYIELDTGATITSNATCMIFSSPAGTGVFNLCD